MKLSQNRKGKEGRDRQITPQEALHMPVTPALREAGDHLSAEFRPAYKTQTFPQKEEQWGSKEGGNRKAQ